MNHFLLFKVTIMVIRAHFSVKMVTNYDKSNNYNHRLHIQMRLFIRTDKTIDEVLFIYFFNLIQILNLL